MQIVIDIPEDTHERITRPDRLFTDDDINKVCWAVYNGTPIPDNATNGKVVQMMFPKIDTNFSNVIDLNLWWKSTYKGVKE